VTRSRFLVLVLGAVAVGAALRLLGLGREGLWLDELASARAASRESLADVVDEVAADIHPPGWFALLYLWTRVFGDGDVALRVPSALAGIAGIPLVAWAGRAVASEGVGVIAAWLAATAPFLVALDREARSNAAMNGLTVLLVATLAAGRRWEVRYVLAGAALLWVHPFAPFVFVFLATWVLIDAPVPRSRWALATGAVATAFAPWLPTVIAQTRTFAADPWYQLPPSDTLGWVWMDLHAGSRSLAALLGAAAIAGAIAVPRIGALLFAASIGLILTPQVGSWLAVPVLRDRNVASVVLVVCLAAAAGIDRLPAHARAPAAGLLVALGGLHAAAEIRAPRIREQWREAAAIVTAGWRDGDAVWAARPVLWWHYLHEPIRVQEPPAAAEPTRRTWLLQAHDVATGAPEELADGAMVLMDRPLVGARVTLVDAGRHRFTLGAELPPPVHDEKGLHFWWAQSVEGGPVGRRGWCVLGVVGRSETAFGVRARLRLAWKGAGASEVDLPEVEGPVEGKAVWLEGPTEVAVSFINDEVEAAGDRNAHVASAFWGCSDNAPVPP
jgi:mannosyltransferase